MKSSMNFISKTYRFLAFFALIGIASAQAEKVSLRTLQLGGNEMPESWVQVADAKEPVKVTWWTTQPTEPLSVLHEGSLKFYRYGQNAEGKPILEVSEIIKLPPSAKEVLLLGWTTKDGVTKYLAIEDQFLNAKFNDWLAINTSPNPVVFLAGEKNKPLSIGPGKSLIFSPNIQEGKGVKILAQSKRGDEKMKIFFSTYWPAFAKQRTMILFYDDGEKMRARRIGDRFPFEEKPEEE